MRGAVDCDLNIVAAVYTHFDTDGRLVSRAFVVSMLSGFVRWEGLVNGMVVNGEMPREISSAIMTASKPFVHGERVIQCVGATRRIVGRMNSDKRRAHRPMQRTSAIPRGNDALRYSYFRCTGGSRTANGDALGTRRAGRKEKPRQDNAKKPNSAKF